MLKIYGSMLCKDCIACLDDLKKAGIGFEFCDFAEDLQHLKTFLVLRDSDPVFEQARAGGYIGIPCIQREDGGITLTWDEFICSSGKT